ncbi:MAG: nitrate reductase cytochrome c-type subunit [Gammaproteobacteria bacterium]
MRRPHRQSLTCKALVCAALVFCAAPHARVEGLRNAPVDSSAAPPPTAAPADEERRRVRNYPEQPPVIPHGIRGYQVDLRFNKCLECHSRQNAPAAGAPMASVTHFMDADFQVLTEVSPRRYFCTQCHVPQTRAVPPVPNTFRGQ